MRLLSGQSNTRAMTRASGWRTPMLSRTSIGMPTEQQDVVRLDVAMQDVMAVQEVERLGRLAEVGEQLAEHRWEVRTR